ncbi:MAG: hypothetical protein WCM76_00980 [Bacteroidota bacterium]
MTKILIMTYFFPPGNFAGSYRIASWAKYLHRFGFYPVIVTRKWENESSSFREMAKPTSKGIVHEKYDTHEVYYLPYRGNLRDSLYVKFGESKFNVLRKTLSLIELIFQNVTNTVIPFRNFYSFSKKLINNDPDIRLMLASGKPYILFKFCYLLNKRFHIPWVADYRDEWTTSQWNRNASGIRKWVLTIESKNEKKWTGSASTLLSVSEMWMESISQFTAKKGHVIMNGFDPADYPDADSVERFPEFSVIYNGTLYPTQAVEVFLEGFIKVINKYEGRATLKIRFPGLLIDPKRTLEVKKAMLGFEENYEIFDRLPKKEVISMQLKSHLLLMVAHNDIKGTHSSKIFEYLACKRAVLLCPSDNDVLADLIIRTNAGFICNNSADVFNLLDRLVSDFITQKKSIFNGSISEIQKYSRENQALKLAGILKEL